MRANSSKHQIWASKDKQVSWLGFRKRKQEYSLCKGGCRNLQKSCHIHWISRCWWGLGIVHQHWQNHQNPSNLGTIASLHWCQIDRVQQHCPLAVAEVLGPQTFSIVGSGHVNNLALHNPCNHLKMSLASVRSLGYFCIFKCIFTFCSEVLITIISKYTDVQPWDSKSTPALAKWATVHIGGHLPTSPTWHCIADKPIYSHLDSRCNNQPWAWWAEMPKRKSKGLSLCMFRE